MEKYKRISQVGEGAFGKVFKSKDLEKNIDVAIKRIPVEIENGIPFTAYREIKILKKYTHTNLVKLHDAMHEEGFIFLVMDYLPYDLTGLLLSKYKFQPDQIRGLIYQLCLATSYLHSQNIIHRDIKASNILIDNNGVLKLTDFGLAREQGFYMTNRVCTLWYRAIELLLGEIKYTCKVDSWSIGIIFLEMKLGHVPFKGSNEAPQVKEIVKVLGIPEERYQWSDLFELNRYKKDIPHSELIKEIYSGVCDEQEIILLKELLCLNSKERISPKYALKLKFFQEIDQIYFPIELNEVHEFDIKKSDKDDN
ncbi:CTD kinase subunit alpha (CTK1) [Vairimorpha necatrix]|uniref:CTD kinase subunit alpha (CTK1) n=1 Tax=Vairimorpha necatrix TaxID=6039 RepID=A0AAX4JEH5_9MICR